MINRENLYSNKGKKSGLNSFKTRTAIANGLIYFLLTVLAIIWIIPLVWLVIASLRKEPGAYTPYILPKEYTFDNYIKLFTNTQLFNYPRWFRNTLVVAIFSCILSTLYTLGVSYALSRLRFKLRKPLMNVALVLGMFPGFMSMIVIYHIIKAIGLEQSLTALVLVYSGGAGLGYYISKGFFDTIPRALDEAATIDGATRSQIFWKITLPLSRPIITYTVLTSFLAPWMDFIFASVIMKDNYNNYTIAVGLYQMTTRENIYNYFTQFCAGAVLIAIPITILFIIMQKNYVEGVTGGSVKG
ncbi:sugar ABC transporter permease [Clostridium thermarum]|uniref:sugar ABC transporter permease n=1 Tax=Clostridium thermarum TaxID=1716543 RepID=UPI001123F8C2|nr:sugar ABC transporter permease [Clostridium thermarum]